MASVSYCDLLYQGLGREQPPQVERCASVAMTTGQKTVSSIIRRSATRIAKSFTTDFSLGVLSIRTSSERRPYRTAAESFSKIQNADGIAYSSNLDVTMERLEAKDTSVAGDCSHYFGVLEDSSHSLVTRIALEEPTSGTSGEDGHENSVEDVRKNRGGTTVNKYGEYRAEGGPELSGEVEMDRMSVGALGPAEGKNSNSENKRKRRNRIAKELLVRGKSPIELLESMEECTVAVFWTVVNILCINSRASEALLVFEWWKRQEGYVARERDFIGFISICGHAGMPEEAQKLFNEMIRLGLSPTVATYSSLLQGFAEVGDFDRAKEILMEMRRVGLKPNSITYTGLLYAYGKQGHYSEMAKIFNSMKTYESSQLDCAPTSVTYSALLQCFAKGGLFARMENALKEMISRNYDPDGAAINAMIQGYAQVGLLKDMERAYSMVRPYKVMVRVDTIRAVALAYIRKSYFYQLGTFARYHNRRRVSVDKLIENLLLLSHAANFSMRGLAEEYVRLKETGFEGDITSFNIRALAFSKMQMLWDLRVTILEMAHQGIMPDLVTYGAVVDAYIGGNMESSLAEALAEMRNIGDVAKVYTDELVFDAFGRGSFQTSCEELFVSSQDLEERFFTYENLVGYYLKRLEIWSTRKRRKKFSKYP
ncbi:unnamed protein product [Calypogeia fissa]